jgi:hypothetical protein
MWTPLPMGPGLVETHPGAREEAAKRVRELLSEDRERSLEGCIAEAGKILPLEGDVLATIALPLARRCDDATTVRHLRRLAACSEAEFQELVADLRQRGGEVQLKKGKKKLPLEQRKNLYLRAWVERSDACTMLGEGEEPEEELVELPLPCRRSVVVTRECAALANMQAPGGETGWGTG